MRAALVGVYGLRLATRADLDLRWLSQQQGQKLMEIHMCNGGHLGLPVTTLCSWQGC
jgi:hypothetical protein